MNRKKTNNFPTKQEVITRCETVIKVCNKVIEQLSHPDILGCCLCKCNSIVINKERMMTITTDKTHHTTHEFSPLYPTFFSPEVANDIVKNDIYRDNKGCRIKMEIVGKLEYYQLLKRQFENLRKSYENLTRF